MGGVGIASIRAWEALDSRGTPTVACEVRLDDGARGVAAVPSGASTGSHEALELRDREERFGGLRVRRAVANVNEILGAALVAHDPADQAGLDGLIAEVDGTANLSRLGANAALGISIAASIAGAQSEDLPLYRWVAKGADPVLPLPMVNVISGGAHAGRIMDFQDFLVVPVGAETFSEAIEIAWRVRAATAELAARQGYATSLVADEGGLGLPLAANRQALDLLVAGIEHAGLDPGEDASVAIDVAATQLLVNGQYRLDAEGRFLSSQELIEELAGWCADHPIVSIEDPLGEDDWDGWTEATRRLGDQLQLPRLVGDDLLAGDVERLERAVQEKAGNAVLIKPNQVGTLTAARRALERGQEAGLATVVSTRSGDSRRFVARGSRGRLAGWPNQGRLVDAGGAHCEMESTARHRVRARRRRAIRRTRHACTTLKQRLATVFYAAAEMLRADPHGPATLCLWPAPPAEDQTSECEAEPKGSDRERSHRDHLAPGRESRPTAQSLLLVTRKRFTAPPFALGSAGPEAEVDIVEDLSSFFRHATTL